MTAYSRQTDFAHRIGEISAGYRALTEDLPHDKKFEATLHLCLCQSLLTYCQERCIRSIESNESEVLTDHPARWGLNSNMVKYNTFDEILTMGRVIYHLRNSVSHPNNIDLNSEYPSTGFKEVASLNGYIEAFAFVHSPDVRHNRPCLSDDGQSYPRIFRMDIPIDNLTQFVQELSRFVAEDRPSRNSRR